MVFINVLQQIPMEPLKQKLTSLFAVCSYKSHSKSSFDFILAKPKVDGKVNDVTVQINEPAELRTKFSAIPKPTVTWFVFECKS